MPGDNNGAIRIDLARTHTLSRKAFFFTVSYFPGIYYSIEFAELNRH